MTGTVFSSSNWSGYDEQSFTNPSSALTDFRGCIDISTLSSSWKAAIQSDGADIRVTKGDNTELAIDLSGFAYNAGAPTGYIFFKYSGTLATSGTQNVRVWAGYSGTATAYGTAETYGRDNVWSATLRAFHLESNTTITDSAGNADGTPIASPASATGQLGSAVSCARSTNKYVDCGTSPLANATSFRFSCWFKFTGTNDAAEDTILSDWVSSGNNTTCLLRYDSLNNQIDFYLNDGTAGDGDSYNVSIEDSAFHKLMWEWDGSNKKFFLDGSQVSTDAAYSPSNLSSTITNNLYLGNTPHVTTDSCRGDIDEAILETGIGSARGTAWEALEYSMQSDQATFWGTWAWTSTGGASFQPAWAKNANQLVA